MKTSGLLLAVLAVAGLAACASPIGDKLSYAQVQSLNPGVSDVDADRAISENLAKEKELTGASAKPETPPLEEFMGKRAKEESGGPDGANRGAGRQGAARDGEGPEGAGGVPK